MKRPAPCYPSVPSTESLGSTTSTADHSAAKQQQQQQEQHATSPATFLCPPSHQPSLKRRRITASRTNHHGGRLSHATVLKQLVLSHSPLTSDSLLFTTSCQQPPQRRALLSMDTIDPLHLERYTSTVVNAVRSDDLATLQRLLQEQGPECFHACNRNGETLLHLACRRSEWPVIEFLVQQAKVPLLVRDLTGRTILHDVLWRPAPAPTILQNLIQGTQANNNDDDKDAESQESSSSATKLHPHALLLPDARGHTPLDYCRAHDAPLWHRTITQLLCSDHDSK